MALFQGCGFISHYQQQPWNLGMAYDMVALHWMFSAATRAAALKAEEEVFSVPAPGGADTLDSYCGSTGTVAFWAVIAILV